MSTIYRVFEKLLKERGVSAYKVAKEAKIDNSTLSHWKAEDYEPKLSVLIKIADYFNVPVEIFAKAKREEMKKDEEPDSE